MLMEKRPLKAAKTALKTLVPEKYLHRVWHAIHKPWPREIIVDIAASCNARCAFCPRVYMDPQRAKGFMAMDLFALTLAEAKKAGIRRLRLYSTAEPLLHPQFDGIVSLAREEDFFITVSTNASLLHRHVDALLKVDVLQYSLEGWDKESYERYRKPLSFERTRDNITLFEGILGKTTGRKPRTMANLLLTRETDMRAYLKTWGNLVDVIVAHMMLPATVYEEGKFTARYAADMAGILYDFEPTKGYRYCVYPFELVSVSFDGKIYLCCNDFSASLELGNIRDGIGNVFNSDRMKEIRQQFKDQTLKICSGCSSFLCIRGEERDRVRREVMTEAGELAVRAKVVFP